MAFKSEKQRKGFFSRLKSGREHAAQFVTEHREKKQAKLERKIEEEQRKLKLQESKLKTQVAKDRVVLERKRKFDNSKKQIQDLKKAEKDIHRELRSRSFIGKTGRGLSRAAVFANKVATSKKTKRTLKKIFS